MLIIDDCIIRSRGVFFGVERQREGKKKGLDYQEFYFGRSLLFMELLLREHTIQRG